MNGFLYLLFSLIIVEFISAEASAEPPPESTLSIIALIFGFANASSSCLTTLSEPVERPPTNGIGREIGGGGWLSPLRFPEPRLDDAQTSWVSNTVIRI